MSVRLKAGLVLDDHRVREEVDEQRAEHEHDRAARRGERPRRLPAGERRSGDQRNDRAGGADGRGGLDAVLVDERPGQEGGHDDGSDRRDPRGDRPRALARSGRRS